MVYIISLLHLRGNQVGNWSSVIAKDTGEVRWKWDTYGLGEVIYRKIKHLTKYGWVDFDFKNPNTLSSKRKEKVINLKAENQILKARLKDSDRYFKLKFIKTKRTKKQEQWIEMFLEETIKRINENK